MLESSSAIPLSKRVISYDNFLHKSNILVALFNSGNHTQHNEEWIF